MQTIKVMIGYFKSLAPCRFFNIDVTVVPVSLKKFISIMSFFNFDPSASLKCFGMRYNFFDRLTLMCSIPIVLFAVTLVSSFLIAVLIRSSIKRSVYLKLRSKIILFLVVFFHPSVSTSIFQLFNCVRVEDTASFLKADYTLQCFDARVGIRRIRPSHRGVLHLWHASGFCPDDVSPVQDVDSGEKGTRRSGARAQAG